MLGRRLTIVILLAAPAQAQPAGAATAFREAVNTGILFTHERGSTPSKHPVEAMGSGCAILDYDLDGRLDLFLVGGGTSPATSPTRAQPDALYRNVGKLRFENATSAAGLKTGAGHGMGAAVGDIDNDGDPDLLVTRFGANSLYLNRGDGTFEDIATAAGVSGDVWSTSAAFLDHDGDGDLDLYVAHYLAMPDALPECLIEGVRATCHPLHFDGEADQLFRNDGGGRFTDVSVEAGVSNVAGKGLGVVAADLDDDGKIDIAVANDAVRNFLYRNKGDGSFEDVSLLSGTGYDVNGRPEAGMGIDAADYDGDGRLDLWVTNYDLETNALYHNEGRMLFTDRRWPAGTAASDHRRVGFGTAFADMDLDGDPDLFVANGHVVDNVDEIYPGRGFAQGDQILLNESGRYTEDVSFSRHQVGAPRPGRGLCTGDLDGDGDVDVVVTNAGAAPQVFINETAPAGGWLVVQLVGTSSNRDGVGATVRVEAGGTKQVDQVTGGGSYLSAGDRRLVFGLGRAESVRSLQVRWPSGVEQKLENIPVRQVLVVEEPADS